MADEKPDDEKTEAPTARRREQAREKGDRLVSKELATAMSGVAGAFWLWQYSGDFGAALRLMLANALRIERADIADYQPFAALAAMLQPLGGPLLALGGLVLVAATLGQALSGGVSFTPSLLAPKAERMDPLKGFGRLLGKRGLVELLKALAKVAVLLGLSAWLLYGKIPDLLRLSAMPLEATAAQVQNMALTLLFALTIGLALIAGGDVPVQIRQWVKRLRMTRQDVQDEVKQQEGNAQVKYAIRRMARDGLKRASRSAMADATVVLTNPTHFAVALRYRPELDAAPVIVARGRGMLADVIRELASERGVVTLSYPSVARAVYFTGRVGHVIRADLFGAVAAILAYVLRVGQEAADPPPVEAPETARFDPDGRMVAG